MLSSTFKDSFVLKCSETLSLKIQVEAALTVPSAKCSETLSLKIQVEAALTVPSANSS